MGRLKNTPIYLVLFLSACASIEQRQVYFEQDLNNYIGKNINTYWVAQPMEVISEDGGTYYRYFNEDNGCKWAIFVDQSEVIQSWKYIGSPDNCYEDIDWGGPW